MTSRPRRILTVCLGNHCRSPYAAAVLARLAGPTVTVRSAGTRDKHVGKPAHPIMVSVAARRGYDLTRHRGQQVDEDLLAWADLILAMDHAILAALRATTGPTLTADIRPYLDDLDVPDPWGRPYADFTACARIIEAGAARHLT